MPFRDAHAVVGSVVRQSLDDRTPMADLVRAHPDLGEDAAALLEPGVSVTRRTTPGGAGPGPVATQVERLRARAADDRPPEGRRVGTQGGMALGTRGSPAHP